MKICWRPRHEPLPVAGCWAEGTAGKQLRQKLLSKSRMGLRVAEADGQVVALGPEPPWVDGAVFLTRQGNLYLPTLLEPNIPTSWIEAKLTELGDPPWVLLPSGRVLGLSKASVIA
jgi:hypothetical protein